MIYLLVGIEELAGGGAASDYLIGDAHDQLRKMDVKNARPQKWQGTMGDTTTGLLELKVSGQFCGSVPLKRFRRERRPKYRTTTKASSNPALINSDMSETHTDMAPSLMKPSASATAVANIQNIEVLIDVGEWKQRV